MCCAVFAVSAAPLFALAGPPLDPTTVPARTAAKTLTLESVEFEGAWKTSDALLTAYLGLDPGAPLDQAAILDGIENLRTTGFFESVEFYTRPGSERGAIVLVVEVVEKGADLRFGTGNSDLDGWYVIPAELSLDNITGRGERAALQLRFGYRLVGVNAHYLRGTAAHERTFWGARAHVHGLDQVYFEQGIEYAQPVARGGLDLHAGRKLGGGWSWSVGLRAESVEVDSTGTVWHADETRDVESGDDVEFEDLPAEIAAGVGRYDRVAWRTDLTLDNRSPHTRAGTPESGFWGRLRLEAVRQAMEDGDEAQFGAASLDFRAYRKLGTGVFAWSARGAITGSETFFPDRHYLGGLYTVRGFPNAAFSGPGGDRGIWHTSLEYRAPLIGSPERPRVAGSLFVDVGGQLVRNGESGRPVAAGAGWGLRVRLFESWYLGTDVAAPLTDSPVDETFHAHLSLGWRF